MKCILTGFDAFDNAETNPSQQAVELVADRLSPGDGNPDVEVNKIILPTCCQGAWEQLRQAVDPIAEKEDFAIVMCGLAGNRESISLERFALNVRDYPIADNKGHIFTEQKIDERGPDALRSRVAIGKLKESLAQMNFRVETSYHAGTFVCNDLYYHALEKWLDHPRCKGILFVHVPPLGTYARMLTGVHQFVSVETSLKAAMLLQAAAEAGTLQQFSLALTEIVKFLCRHGSAD